MFVKLLEISAKFTDVGQFPGICRNSRKFHETAEEKIIDSDEISATCWKSETFIQKICAMLRKLQMLGKKRCKKRIKFVDLEKCFKVSLQLRNSALSQPKTDLPKFTRDRNLRQSLTPCWTIIVLNVCNQTFILQPFSRSTRSADAAPLWTRKFTMPGKKQPNGRIHGL